MLLRSCCHCKASSSSLSMKRPRLSPLPPTVREMHQFLAPLCQEDQWKGLGCSWEPQRGCGNDTGDCKERFVLLKMHHVLSNVQLIIAAICAAMDIVTGRYSSMRRDCILHFVVHLYRNRENFLWSKKEKSQLASVWCRLCSHPSQCWESMWIWCCSMAWQPGLDV